MASANNATSEGSEPINFRAALAAFEQNTASSTGFHSPKPRPPQPAATRLPPQTPARPSSGFDPVPRSSSTPRIRNNSGGLMPPSSNNPFASASTASALPTTSASGMLSAPPPALSSSASPAYPKTLSVRKSGSGVSLNELANNSSARKDAGSRTASPLLRSRSRSVAETEAARNASNAGSAPTSGRSSPYVPRRMDCSLFVPDEAALTRADSPASTSQHMLDTSADDDMFAHAVMERSSAPGSPSRRAAEPSLVPPQVPSRKGSASSTNSASTPRLPPRPGGSSSSAPSPTISEFGQYPTATPKAKTGLAYATYTPGAKRVGSQDGRVDGSMTPPALPPRSATLGGADRGRDSPLQRQSSPAKRAPVVPKKPSVAAKPPPPPRPGKTWEGAAGGFRFGAAGEEQPLPPPRQRTMVTHQRSLTGSSGSLSGVHRKSGSGVFTSISLSDDASGELKRSLESDLHADHAQQKPPSRGRVGMGAAPARAGAAGSMVSSLIGAASTLPLFKPVPAGSGRLAEGAPSKQGIVPRSASVPAVEAEASLWGGTVKLADHVSKVVKEPRNEGARKRYEGLFDELVQQKRKVGTNSNASTIREAVQGERKSSGVQALKGWFESDPATGTTSPNPSDLSVPSTLSSRTVRRVWLRSHLPASFLAQVWDQAAGPRGRVDKESFVRAMASIDAELERRKQRREGRARVNKVVAGRRLPPPPPGAVV